jgi:hypothetical protein
MGTMEDWRGARFALVRTSGLDQSIDTDKLDVSIVGSSVQRNMRVYNTASYLFEISGEENIILGGSPLLARNRSLIELELVLGLYCSEQ